MRTKAEEDRKYTHDILEHVFGVASETVTSLTERPLVLLSLLLGVMTVVAGMLASRDMVAVMRKVLERRFARPGLVREYWRGGWMASWKKAGVVGDKRAFDGIYLEKELEERLCQLSADLHGARQKGLPLRNLLIYGPSGKDETH